jgi:hypothetical protein
MPVNRLRTFLSATACTLFLAAAASGAPIYMKYDGVDGDVARAGRGKWIEVVSYQFAVDREGKPSCASGEASFTIPADSKAVPGLLQASSKGKIFRTVTVDADGTLHTLQSARVNKIDALTVKQKVIELGYGRCLTHAKSPGKK